MENKLNDTFNWRFSGVYDSHNGSEEYDSDDVFSGNISSWAGEENYVEFALGCTVKTSNALLYALLVLSSVCIVLTGTTLLTITCNHRHRKKRFIFPFNIILADFVMNAVQIIWYAGAMQVCMLSIL